MEGKKPWDERELEYNHEDLESNQAPRMTDPSSGDPNAIPLQTEGDDSPVAALSPIDSPSATNKSPSTAKHPRGEEGGSADLPQSAESLLNSASQLLNSAAVRKNISLVKQKAQDFMHTGKDQIADKMHVLSDDMKVRSKKVDESIKANPYIYAALALGVGFLVGRKAKGDWDLNEIVGAVNRIDFAGIAALLGLQTGEKSAGSQSSPSQKVG